MKLVVENGKRLDRPPMTELDFALWHYKRMSYSRLSDLEKQRFRHLLDLEHERRESMRFTSYGRKGNNS